MFMTTPPPLPTIQGPLVVYGKPNRPFDVTYTCPVPSPIWGVGTDGDGSTITGIVPLGNGVYKVTLTRRENDLVWISDVPDGPGPTGCASIQVRFIARHGRHRHHRHHCK